MTKSINTLYEAQRKCYNDAFLHFEDKCLNYIKEPEQKFHDIISRREFSQKELVDLKSNLANPSLTEIRRRSELSCCNIQTRDSSNNY